MVSIPAMCEDVPLPVRPGVPGVVENTFGFENLPRVTAVSKAPCRGNQ